MTADEQCYHMTDSGEMHQVQHFFWCSKHLAAMVPDMKPSKFLSRVQGFGSRFGLEGSGLILDLKFLSRQSLRLNPTSPPEH